MSETARFYERLSYDFAAFDIEKALKSPLRDAAKLLRAGTATLREAAGVPSRLGDRVDELLAALGGPDAQLTDVVRDAELAEKIAAVMECAVRYRTLAQRQRDLVRQLRRFESPSTPPDPRLLALLAERQAAIRSELDRLRQDLAEKASAVSDACPKLYMSADNFAVLIDTMGIADFMHKAEDAALNEDGTIAHQNAALALERMEQLMSEQKSGAFGGMCNGRDLTFTVPKDLASTLEQLLAGLAMRAGGGVGAMPGMGGVGQAGVGMGGSGDGYFMQGRSPLNVPVHGPARMRFTARTAAGITGVGGRGADGKPLTTGAEESAVVEGSTETTIDTRSMPIENIPEKYREAVKRYFAE